MMKKIVFTSVHVNTFKVETNGVKSLDRKRKTITEKVIQSILKYARPDHFTNVFRNIDVKCKYNLNEQLVNSNSNELFEYVRILSLFL